MNSPPASNTPAGAIPIPMSRRAVVDGYFMEHRGKVLDIAAFLDRVDRAGAAPGESSDFRVQALLRALAIISDGRPERARRVLEALSDATTEPVPAAGTKGAAGAPAPPDPRLAGGRPA